MPQGVEPFKFTDITVPSYPGIGRAKEETAVTIGGASNTEHTLASHPQVAGNWDNVYMPQPMTRERRGDTASTESPPVGSNTLGDPFRFWPAHRDMINGAVDGPDQVYKTKIGSVGCNRYTGVFGNSSDEGWWDSNGLSDGAFGTNVIYESDHIGLNSPAYEAIYQSPTGSNSLWSDHSDWTSANYLGSFLNTFAKGYYNNCCILNDVSVRDDDTNDNKDGPDTWGFYSEDKNISYGIFYHDYWAGCDPFSWGGNNDLCCGDQELYIATYNFTTPENNCGGIFYANLLSNSAILLGGSSARYTAGLLSTKTLDKHAAAQWLSPSGDYTWKESDVKRRTEYSRNEFGTHNPPGKFGIIDNSRTNRQANDLSCLKVGEMQIHPSGYDGVADTNEKCTYLCNSLGSFFIHEGRVFESTSLSPTS